MMNGILCRDRTGRVTPAYIGLWGISSVGRVPALHAGCQEFESPILQFKPFVQKIERINYEQ